MRRPLKNPSGLTNRASGRSRTKVAKAASISRLVLVRRTWICSPIERAAAEGVRLASSLPWASFHEPQTERVSRLLRHDGEPVLFRDPLKFSRHLSDLHYQLIKVRARN